jgi:hypothetical protein
MSYEDYEWILWVFRRPGEEKELTGQEQAQGPLETLRP